MSAAEPPPASPGRRLGALAAARAVDQGVLGLGALVLAHELGPQRYAPVAVLLIVNSLVVQVADLGVGFAVLRTPPPAGVATASLARVRRVGGAAVVSGGLAAVAAWSAGAGSAAVVLGGSGLLWWAAGEARVRKAALISGGAARRAAVIEMVGAGVLAAVIAAIAGFDGTPAWLAAGLLVKHVTEIAGATGWRARFDTAGDPARSGPEWLGQVITYLAANVDYVVLGARLGAVDLSRYAVAYRVASAAPALVSTPVTQTALVDFAGATSDGRQAVHDALRRRVLGIGAVGAVGASAVAPVLATLLGDDWTDVGWLVVVLATAIPFRLLLGMSVAQAVAAGRAGEVVRWESARLVAIAAAVVVGSSGGVVWAAAAVSTATVVSVTSVYLVSARITDVRPWGGMVPAATGAVAVTMALAAVAG